MRKRLFYGYFDVKGVYCPLVLGSYLLDLQTVEVINKTIGRDPQNLLKEVRSRDDQVKPKSIRMLVSGRSSTHLGY